MASALGSAADKLEAAMRRAKMPPSDIRYLIGALANAREVLVFCSDHSLAIEKAAKRQVPWRSQN